MRHRFPLLIAFLFFITSLLADDYMQAPEPINRILAAPRAPWLWMSPRGDCALEVSQADAPSIQDIAFHSIDVAGLRIDPRNNGPADASYIDALELIDLTDASRRGVALPTGRVDDLRWNVEGDQFAFTLTTVEGIELWSCNTGDLRPVRVVGPQLNAALGTPYDWLPGRKGFLVKLVPEGRGMPPHEAAVQGPLIEESAQKQAAGRTWQNLLVTQYDEDLFVYYATSQMAYVSLKGKIERLGEPAIFDEITPSPDGSLLLVREMPPPYPRQNPLWQFPLTIDVRDLKGSRRFLLAELPLADTVPLAFGSVRTGRRDAEWRDDKAAELVWVEALDGGDAGAEAEFRDAVYHLSAPFEGEARLLAKTGYRYYGIQWGDENHALLSEGWYKTRQRRDWFLDPASGDTRLLRERNMEDAYADPGSPETRRNQYGRHVLLLGQGGKSLYYSGRGASPEGVYPFLDRYDLETGDTKRLWQCEDPYYTRVMSLLNDDPQRLLIHRQSKQDPPNYFIMDMRSGTELQLTFYVDPAPELDGIQREIVRYMRSDSLELSGTLYTPPGYDSERDGPLPTILWVYPQEFRSKEAAGQVTTAENTFFRPRGLSITFLLTQGYAVLGDPAMPIIGEGEAEPNDTYIEQLVASAEAAVDYLVSRGVSQPGHLGIGGHSYGAFTTANLLAHTDLFACGIARSGAYNRSLTPFGFQGEERNYWEAQSTYQSMSPFNYADRINEPLLMIHGTDDDNSGTFPIQSERLFDAIKGLGGTVRLVKLPWEGHAYRANESVTHVQWEMVNWCDKWLKGERRPEL